MHCNYLLTTFSIITTFTFLTSVQPSSLSTKSPIDEEIEYFQVQFLVQQMKEYAKNITFNSTREKHMFIYYPLMEKCLETIGQEFELFVKSVPFGGIGAASYGIAVGTKIAIKTGILKMGLPTFIKAITTAFASTTALPIAVGVGTMTYLYNKNQRNQIKRKCHSVLKQINRLADQQDFSSLNKIKTIIDQQLLFNRERLNFNVETMKFINKKIRNYRTLLKKVEIREKILENYFRVFKKLTKHY